MQTQQQDIDRARKLLNVTEANGATAHEAKTARERAKTILGRHNMTVEEVEAQRPAEPQDEPPFGFSDLHTAFGDIWSRMGHTRRHPFYQAWTPPNRRDLEIDRYTHRTEVNFRCQRCGRRNGFTIVVPCSASKAKCGNCDQRHHIDLNACTIEPEGPEATATEQAERERRRERRLRRMEARRRRQEARVARWAEVYNTIDAPEEDPTALLKGLLDDIGNGVPVMGRRVRELGNAMLKKALWDILDNNEERNR